MIVDVRLRIDIPDIDGLTDEQIDEFIKFELGYSAGMSLKNPLCDEQYMNIKSVEIYS